MLTLRLIDLDDYTVHEDGPRIGRIRYASERAPPCWLWTITVLIPGADFGDAATLDEAKSRFRVAWETFKDSHGAEKLAKAYAEMNWADRYRR